MSKDESIMHSMLVVGGSEKFDAVIRDEIPRQYFMAVDSKRSATAGRQAFMERFYDIIVINLPLPDERGIEFALDVAEQSNASVFLIVPADEYHTVLERVTNYGILAIPKPFPRGRVSQAVRYLMAEQRYRRALERKLEQTKEKMEELRIVSKAKILLVEREHMTEDEAHRHIGKLAMDRGTTRRRIAEELLEIY